MLCHLHLFLNTCRVLDVFFNTSSSRPGHQNITSNLTVVAMINQMTPEHMMSNIIHLCTDIFGHSLNYLQNMESHKIP